MNFFKHNAQHFAYTNDLLTIDIFGGIEGHPGSVSGTGLMDGLFATLKIALADSSRPPIRHNLDLFNDNQMTRLITKVCERLEIGHSLVSSSLSEVVERLEAERLQQFDATQTPNDTLQALSAAEEKDALKALKSKDLMNRTFKAFEVMGICGEAYNAMILHLTMLSRRLPEPISVICMAGSGAGKSYLVEKIAECVPVPDVREYTQLTAASLYHHQKHELAGKVLLIEDLISAKGAMTPIRSLQSNKKITKTMTVKDRSGDLRAMDFVVEGPLCVIASTTYDKVFAENANRCLLLTLDTSEEQDRRIMDYQKQRKAGLIDESKIELTQYKMMNLHRVLKPTKIINPYAPLIELPKETLHPRRTLQLVLNFIDAITFYHQYQRQVTADNNGEEAILTEPDDIKWGFELLKDVLFVKSDELPSAVRSFYQWLVEWSSPDQDFTAATIRQFTKVNPRTLSRYLKELTEYNYLKITGGNRHTTGYTYALADKANNQLTNSIEKQLSEVMEQVNKVYQKQSKATNSDLAKTNPSQSDVTRPKAK